jgi:hypothetical protein
MEEVSQWMIFQIYCGEEEKPALLEFIKMEQKTRLFCFRQYNHERNEFFGLY